MYNKFLAIRFWLDWNLFGWNDIAMGYEKINKLGYTKIEQIKFTDFLIYPKHPDNWGVAFPGMDSAFNKYCSEMEDDQATVYTDDIPCSGYGFETTDKDGHKIPPKLEHRPTMAGKIYKRDFKPVGVFSTVMTLEYDALGSWDAWWFFMENQKGETGYYEIDMMERFYGKPSESTVLTTSIHQSDTERTNGMMHNCSYRVKKHKRIHQAVEFCEDGKIKIYVNGSLVWIDFMFPPKTSLKGKTLTMIANNGLQARTYHGKTKELLSVEPFTFRLNSLYHHTK